MILGGKDDDVERIQVSSPEKKSREIREEACSFPRLEVDEEMCQERQWRRLCGTESQDSFIGTCNLNNLNYA